MSHQQQRDFFNEVKNKYPNSFNNVTVLDFGSLDVNGSLLDLFTNSNYLGIDIVAGNNVDIISTAHEYRQDNKDKLVDTVVSGEMLEHDEYWRLSLKNMYDICKSGGLIAISCAGKDRPEHGTTRTGDVWGTSNDYYMNIEPSDIKEVFKDDMFEVKEYAENTITKDTYFWGIKK